jgi:predicted metal-dependent phosphoesterase TrpH
MIDLHTHTTESDGTLTPKELIEEARRVGLQALAITDHDTLAGYELAVPCAEPSGIELLCGVELSVKYRGGTIHLLAYFLKTPPTEQFREWLLWLQAGRRRRNEALVRKLCAAGMPITLQEVAARGGTLLARPHFAAVMLEKGYVKSRREAFEKYLDQSGSCYVPRDEPEFEEAVARIHASHGIAVLPHPARIGVRREYLERMVADMCALGLQGIEAYYSEHAPAEAAFFLSLARKFNIAATGGSDFHGGTKPEIALGTGIRNNLQLPYSILEELRQFSGDSAPIRAKHN